MSAAVTAVKLVSGLIVSTGVGTIVASTARFVVPKATNKAFMKVAHKTSVVVGAAVLSSMVADQAVKYTEDKIDNAVESATEIVTTVKAELQKNKDKQ